MYMCKIHMESNSDFSLKLNYFLRCEGKCQGHSWFFIDIGIDQFLMTHHLLAIYECSSYKIRGLENFSFSAWFSSTQNKQKFWKKYYYYYFKKMEISTTVIRFIFINFDFFSTLSSCNISVVPWERRDFSFTLMH